MALDSRKPYKMNSDENESLTAAEMSNYKMNPRAKADKQIVTNAMPEKVIADATTAQKVGKGKLLRIEGTAGGFIAFDSDGSLGVPGALTNPPTLKTEAEFFYIVAPDSYIRTSAVMRIEIIRD